MEERQTAWQRKKCILTLKSHTRTHARDPARQFSHPSGGGFLPVTHNARLSSRHWLAFPYQSLRRLLQHTPAPPALHIMPFQHMLIPMPLDDLVRRGLAYYRRQRTAPRTTVTGRTISATDTESLPSLVPTARGLSSMWARSRAVENGYVCLLTASH